MSNLAENAVRNICRRFDEDLYIPQKLKPSTKMLYPNLGSYQVKSSLRKFGWAQKGMRIFIGTEGRSNTGLCECLCLPASKSLPPRYFDFADQRPIFSPVLEPSINNLHYPNIGSYHTKSSLQWTIAMNLHGRFEIDVPAMGDGVLALAYSQGYRSLPSFAVGDGCGVTWGIALVNERQ